MNQKNIIIGIVALLVLLLVLVGVIFFVHPSTTPTATNSGAGNPFGSSTASGTTQNTSSSTSATTGPLLPVTLKDNSTVVVPNFTTKNQPPLASAENGYQVAGANTGSFQVLYFPSGSYFLVTLNSEPLGQTRLSAESALRTQLGLTDAQLCTLNIQVFTPGFVNASYAGQDLGLSFCPGATALP